MAPISVDRINEFIFSYLFKINENCQNEHCNVHNILYGACKRVDEKENNNDKITVFREFYH